MNPDPSRREIRRAVERLRVGRDRAPSNAPAVGPNGERIEIELADEHAAELREHSPGDDMSADLAEAIRSAEMAALTEALDDETDAVEEHGTGGED